MLDTADRPTLSDGRPDYMAILETQEATAAQAAAALASEAAAVRAALDADEGPQAGMTFEELLAGARAAEELSHPATRISTATRDLDLETDATDQANEWFDALSKFPTDDPVQMQLKTEIAAPWVTPRSSSPRLRPPGLAEQVCEVADNEPGFTMEAIRVAAVTARAQRWSDARAMLAAAQAEVLALNDEEDAAEARVRSQMPTMPAVGWMHKGGKPERMLTPDDLDQSPTAGLLAFMPRERATEIRDAVAAYWGEVDRLRLVEGLDGEGGIEDRLDQAEARECQARRDLFTLPAFDMQTLAEKFRYLAGRLLGSDLSDPETVERLLSGDQRDQHGDLFVQLHRNMLELGGVPDATADAVPFDAEGWLEALKARGWGFERKVGPFTTTVGNAVPTLPPSGWSDLQRWQQRAIFRAVENTPSPSQVAAIVSSVRRDEQVPGYTREALLAEAMNRPGVLACDVEAARAELDSAD